MTPPDAKADKNGWRSDMENAPRNTAIWLWCDGQAYLGYCEPPEPVYNRDEHWNLKSFARNRNGHVEIMGCSVWRAEPTHWQPLPPPPVEGA